MKSTTSSTFDLAIVGGGTAGLAAAIEAAGRGLQVIVIEAQDRLGGTLHWAAGLLSAAGTNLQRERGISDSPDAHFADVMEISGHTADPLFVRKAVDLAAETVDWLLTNSFDIDPACPRNVQNHAFYSVDRTYWGRNKALSVLEVLLRALETLGSRGPVVELGTRAKRLLKGSGGVISGVEVEGADGQRREILAGNVLVTTGGFAGNPQMFQELTGRRLYGPMPTGSDGSGIQMLLEAGATWRKSPYLMSSVGGIEDEDGTGRVSFYERPQLIPQHRQPWEIYVSRNGRRFMREDNPVVDEREQDLAKLDETTFWIVMDSRMVKDSPPLFPMWDETKYHSFLGSHSSVSSAPSIRALAEKTGIDAAALLDTVSQYNRAVDAQEGDALDRQHLPARIETAPFYVIRNHAVIIKSHWGVHVDASLRVLGVDGVPFSNLYACGEALGGSLLSGNSYVTGMSITPALSFGRLLGRTLE